MDIPMVIGSCVVIVVVSHWVSFALGRRLGNAEGYADGMEQALTYADVGAKGPEVLLDEN